MSDEVTNAQQRQEELDAMAPCTNGPETSNESERPRRTELWVRKASGGRVTPLSSRGSERENVVDVGRSPERLG